LLPFFADEKKDSPLLSVGAGPQQNSPCKVLVF
jgi:hypothetical protein